MIKNQKKNIVLFVVLLSALMSFGLQAQDAAARRGRQSSEGDFEAQQLVERAKELLSVREYDRGVRMLENVFEQYPNSRIRFKARLELGKHFVENQRYSEAIGHLRALSVLNRPDQELIGEEKDWYLEAQYLTGVAYFHMRQYGYAFTALRSITRDYPDTVWANQAYYYIGMSHFAQQNWNRAIETLNMVGTFVDPDGPESELVEAGRRLYVKVSDADIPILYQTGGAIKLELKTESGDQESVECVPLDVGEGLAMASIRTEPGVAVPGDGILQVVGGDMITVNYYDENTSDGSSRVLRQVQVKVVSTAYIEFPVGNFESKAAAAFLGQPLFILLTDLDKDVSPAAEEVVVKVVSRYKRDLDESVSRAVDITKMFLEDDMQEYEIRDEVFVSLFELGEKVPIHSGRFGGSVFIQPFEDDLADDSADVRLKCALGDEIIVYYQDDLHIGGDSKREVAASIIVAGEIDGRPMVSQNVVFDPDVRARKNLVEASAFLELTRIFKSMGLMNQAMEKSQEGIDRVQDVILTAAPISRRLKEDAFKTKWELLIERGDYNQAVATCRLFSVMFPGSPFADDALLQIGMARIEEREYAEAIRMFSSVVNLPTSGARAEAQFRIAEAHEQWAQQLQDMPQGKGVAAATTRRSAAMQAYKLCAERYPDSEYAGQSLGKLIDYYLENRDYAQADYLLEMVFQDYPDAAFLDSMLLKWVITAHRMGNIEKAREKANKLIFDYPASPFAAHAQRVLPQLERK